MDWNLPVFMSVHVENMEQGFVKLQNLKNKKLCFEFLLFIIFLKLETGLSWCY